MYELGCIKMDLKKECGVITWTEVGRVRTGTDSGFLKHGNERLGVMKYGEFYV